MADHNKPTTASPYVDFVSELDARLDDLSAGLDPAYITASNVPTNALRLSSAAGKWQRWNGTSWVDAVTTYSISISGNAATVTNGVVTTGSYVNPAWITSLDGAKVTGNIGGNAGSATVLQTARTINGVSFNGSANISVNTNNSLAFNNAGSGAASGAAFNGSTAFTVSYNTVGAPSTTGANASGTWAISISGNAATATRAFPRRSDGGDMNFYWSGQTGQPTWLWGGTDGVNFYVYNPSNFNVNYATTAGSAGSAGSVPWTGVTGRPTAVSSFTNDAGYITTAGVSTASVLSATAGASYGAVGTYVFAFRNAVGTGLSPGDTTAGSQLAPASISNDNFYPQSGGSALSGTWRHMGYPVTGTSYYTLFLRIS